MYVAGCPSSTCFAVLNLVFVTTAMWPPSATGLAVPPYVVSLWHLADRLGGYLPWQDSSIPLLYPPGLTSQFHDHGTCTGFSRMRSGRWQGTVTAYSAMLIWHPGRGRCTYRCGWRLTVTIHDAGWFRNGGDLMQIFPHMVCYLGVCPKDSLDVWEWGE